MLLSGVEPLIEDLEEDRYVRKEAAKALGQIGDPKAVESLIRALKDKDKLVRAEAAEALGLLKDPRAIGPIVKVLKKEEHVEQRGSGEPGKRKKNEFYLDSNNLAYSIFSCL